MPSPRTALRRQGLSPLTKPIYPYPFRIFRPQVKNPSSLNHLLLRQVPSGLSWMRVLMTSCGQVKSSLQSAASGPTQRASIMLRCSFSFPTKRSLRNSQVANWKPQEGISRTAVEKTPLQTPFSPPSRQMLRRHSLEFLNSLCELICILHLTSSTGETIKVMMSPAKRPFSNPSRQPSSVLPRMVLQSSQELKLTALTTGAVMRGQQMPLKSFMTPSLRTMLAMMRVMPNCGSTCMCTLMVSKQQLERQPTTPEKVPHMKSSTNYFIGQLQLIVMLLGIYIPPLFAYTTNTIYLKQYSI